MRSRYSAFALGDTDYLRQSWHAGHRPAEITPEPGLRWLGLEILAVSEQGDNATVEFEACFLLQGKVDAIHERSDFLREQGRWYYTRGEMLPPGFEPWKPGRNEDCPCGSGKKFKRCCASA